MAPLGAQQIGGIVSVSVVVLLGITLLIGGTTGGWFDGGGTMKEAAYHQEEGDDKEYSWSGDDVYSDRLKYPTPIMRVDDTDLDMTLKRHPGLKGDKGEQGLRGPPGMTVRGPPGPMGPPGSASQDWLRNAVVDDGAGGGGTCGCEEAMLKQFIKDYRPKMIAGPPGAPGAPGTMGPIQRGPAGPPGQKGQKGVQGDPGPEGLIGPKGEAGRDGLPGLPGPPGPPGQQFTYTPSSKYAELNWGKPNVFGGKGNRLSRPFLDGQGGGGGGGSGFATSSSLGPTGAASFRGDVGPRGPRGDQGAKGERGYHGVKGAKGEIGYEGPPGPPGLKGEAGQAAIPGLPGTVGRNGVKGEKGESGRRGAPGPPGPSAYSRQQQGGRAIKGEKGEPGETRILRDNSLHDWRNSKNAFSAAASFPAAAALPVVGSLSELKQSTSAFPLGSLIFLEDADVVVVRCNKEWREMQLGAPVLSVASDSTVATSVHSPQDPWATNSAGGGVVSVSSKPRKGPAAATKKKTAGFMPFPKESFPAAPDQHALPPVFRNAAGRDMPDRRPSALRLVALDSPMSGSLHGALGVDYQCYREASQNGVAGSFRGFIAPPKDKASQGGHNLESIVRYQDRDLPVVNSKGQLLFSTWKSIFENRGEIHKKTATKYGIYSFSGRNVLTDRNWPSKLSWHGVTPWGETSRRAQSCAGWTTDDASAIGMASNLADGMLLQQKKVDCSQKLVVLCVETDSHTLFSTGNRRRRRRRPERALITRREGGRDRERNEKT